ncbi:MAG: outer membrane protein assembly factor BamD [Bacteroidales bacterium]|nr:outer membrane protein assembly factor BamD [Bacteroidales bacterium]
MKKSVFVLTIIILLLSNTGCSKYEKLLKSSDYNLKYQKAKEYYHDKEWVKAATLFEQIMPVFRATLKSDTIAYYHAYCYYHQADYLLSGYYFDNLAKTYPHSSFAEESAFMHAYCLYLSSPRPSLDQTYSLQSIDAFTLYAIKYPESVRIPETKEYIVEMRNKLIEKSYMSAKLYYEMGKYKASIIALRNSIGDFPDTKYREEILFLTLKSSFLLAENSVIEKQKERYQATVDEYYSFVTEYPESKYIKDAEKMYKLSLERSKE